MWWWLLLTALDARVEGGAIVLTKDGKTARYPAASAVLSVVPLRADEQVVWASLGDKAVVLRFADPPIVLATLEEHRSNRVTSVSTRTWIVDLDGDGTNELVRYASERSDIPEQPAGTTVLRFDGRTFVEVKLKAPQAPWANVRRLAQTAAKATQVSYRVFDPVRIGDAPQGLGVAPPFVGPDMLLVTFDKVVHVAHVRLLPVAKVVTTIRVGTLSGAQEARFANGMVEVLDQKIPFKNGVLGAN